MNLPKLQTASRATAFSRLDSRTKLGIFVAVSLVAALWDDPLLGAALMVGVLGACAAVGIPRTYLGLMFRVMLPFFALMLLTHGFFNIQYVQRLTGQEHLTPLLTLPANWWVIGGRSLSEEGLLYGVNVLCKSMTFLLLVPLCVFTTEPNNLIVGLVRLRLPYKLAFVISATLRFFPLIFDEVRAVMETQRLRGFALEEMSARARVRVYAKVAVPVILGAMFKAQQIEVVLQSKAFSGRADRTYLHESLLRGADWVVILGCGLALVGVLLAYFAQGFGRFAVS